MYEKRLLGINVLEAAKNRIAWTFDNFPRIYCSISGGKDSTVMAHLVMDEAKKRERKIGLMYIDFEAQFQHTIDHLEEMYALYSEQIEPYWIALPIHLRNAVSQFQHHWACWNPDRKADWVRQYPNFAISNQDYFPFYKYAMEFEDFVPEFGNWYARGEKCACFVGIRTTESLNRWRVIAGHGEKFEGRNWTSRIDESLYNIYPVYDWTVEDVWTYHAKTGRPYNRIYDLMQMAGVSLHQQRLCQPYGDDQRKGLWLFHILEPDTWPKIVARVNGANQGALYAQESGNILGNIKIAKPEGHTWESFAMLLLESLPPKMRDHYKNKIAVFIKWWEDRDTPMEDEGPIEKGHANWRRICKVLLRNDYWCRGLSFSMHKSGAYEQYCERMKRRREEWGIMN